MQAVFVMAVVTGCGSASRSPQVDRVTEPAMAPTSAASTTGAPPAAPLSVEPSRIRTIDRATITGEQQCGRFSTATLRDVSLLEGRVGVRFLPGAHTSGDAMSQRVLVEQGDASIFIGAYEMRAIAGAAFQEHAQARASHFSPEFEAVAYANAASAPRAVFGVPNQVVEQNGMVFLTHGTYARADGDLIDVAIVVSRSEVQDLDACTRFALHLVDTLVDGPRAMPAAPMGPHVEHVSYARFAFTLPPQWRIAEAYGVDDFARIHFVRVGVFPERATTLQMALDAHPGDWSVGPLSSTREGHLLGLPVTWTLSEAEGSGAAAVSTEVIRHDHAVAAIRAPSPAARDEAIQLAESVQLVPPG